MAPQTQSRKAPPWAVVVLLLIFFFPIGLYLLYQKLSVPPIGRSGGITFLIIGFVFFALAVIDIGERTLGWSHDGRVVNDSLFASVFYTAVSLISGLLCFMAAGMLFKKRRDYQLYAPFLFGHVTTSLDAVAQALSRDYLRVCRDLQRLINAGCLSSAYIDYSNRLFVFSRQWLASPPPPPTVVSEEEEAEEPSGDPDGTDSAVLLARIRELNETIRHPQLSNRIWQIEGLSRKIFQVVESQPEKQTQIRAFMQYYLPTTLRLLDTYAQLEAQQVHGDNIDSAMRRVEAMADTLAEAFKKQLDLLFSGEALDVSAEIRVLEAMLTRDGLTGDNPFSPPPDPNP